MKRLNQHWKVVAYFAGMITVALTLHENVFITGFVGGLVWLVVWIARNGEPGGANRRDLFDGDEDRLREYDDTLTNPAYRHLSYNIYNDR